ncbi:MAG: serine hydrolase domain-containing protein, partial [Paracoccaceae bacterium]
MAGVAEDGVSALLAETGAPAAGMAVLRAGQLTQAAAGLRALGRTDPVTTQDLWHLGSNTKAMTATLVARLVEAGVISWADTVGTVLGSSIEGIDPAYRDATYVDLMQHRSGVPENIGMFLSLRLAGTLTARDMIADRLTYTENILTSPPATAPGQYLYSNAGYVVVGHMLQVATGQSWEDLIREHVFA